MMIIWVKTSYIYTCIISWFSYHSKNSIQTQSPQSLQPPTPGKKKKTCCFSEGTESLPRWHKRELAWDYSGLVVDNIMADRTECLKEETVLFLFGTLSETSCEFVAIDWQEVEANSRDMFGIGNVKFTATLQRFCNHTSTVIEFLI